MLARTRLTAPDGARSSWPPAGTRHLGLAGWFPVPAGQQDDLLQHDLLGPVPGLPQPALAPRIPPPAGRPRQFPRASAMIPRRLPAQAGEERLGLLIAANRPGATAPSACGASPYSCSRRLPRASFSKAMQNSAATISRTVSWAHHRMMMVESPTKLPMKTKKKIPNTLIGPNHGFEHHQPEEKEIDKIWKVFSNFALCFMTACRLPRDHRQRCLKNPCKFSGASV